jgi:two-component SAPR family response regulator
MTTLEGVRVLIVEDNFIVAHSLKSLLSAYGAVVVAMVPSVGGALAVLASDPIDVAILDIHVEGGAVDPLADRLLEARVPFFFISGYGDESVLPQRLRGWPRLDKPVETDLLLATLSRVLGRI